VRNFVADSAHERAGIPVTAEAPADERALALGLVAWDYEQGYQDISCDIACALKQTPTVGYAYWWVIDINVRDGGTEAIVCKTSSSAAEYFLIQGITYDANNEPVIPGSDEWTCVQDKWVAVVMTGSDDDYDEDDDDNAVVVYLNSLRSRHALVIEEARKAAHDEVDARFEGRANGAVTGDGEQGGDDSDDGPSDKHAVDATETDNDENVLGHKPTSNDDANPTGGGANDVGGELGEPDEYGHRTADEKQPTEPEDEERKRAAALARARGRAALA
jgi:hypothetical protein